jgi:hypothetical protein
MAPALAVRGIMVGGRDALSARNSAQVGLKGFTLVIAGGIIMLNSPVLGGFVMKTLF